VRSGFLCVKAFAFLCVLCASAVIAFPNAEHLMLVRPRDILALYDYN